MPALPPGQRATRGVATLAPTAAVLDAIPGALDLLTDAERDRAARFKRDADRMSFVAAHALVRLGCAYRFGTAVTSTLVQQCDRCGGPHGPGRILEQPAAWLSWAHSGGVVAVAVAPTPVGIDVEPLTSATTAADLGPDLSTPAERRAVSAAADPASSRLLLWVRKEALIKLGRTTSDTMSALDLSGLPSDLPGTGQHRRTRWDDQSLVEVALAEPPAIAVAASQAEIDVLRLDELTSVTSAKHRPG